MKNTISMDILCGKSRVVTLKLTMNQSQMALVAQINTQIYGDESSLKVLREKGAFKVVPKAKKKYADELGFFRVVSGRVRVFSVAPNGKEITIFYMTNAECCILSTSFMTRNVQDEVMFEFIEDSEIFTLGDSDYQALCASNANIMSFNLELMSKRFKQSLDTMGDVAFKSLKERIMKFLQSNAKEGVVQTSQENIANHIGSAREAVAKVLKELKNEGLIDTKRGEIIINKNFV